MKIFFSLAIKYRCFSINSHQFSLCITVTIANNNVVAEARFVRNFVVKPRCSCNLSSRIVVRYNFCGREVFKGFANFIIRKGIQIKQYDGLKSCEIKFTLYYTLNSVLSWQILTHMREGETIVFTSPRLFSPEFA